MKQTLVILEVSRKQDYIFASKRLKENAQRSEDIRYVTSSEFFQEVAGSAYQESENLIYAGGGHTVLQFSSSEAAKSFIQAVTHACLERYNGLELFAKQMPYELAKTPGENLKLLSQRLEEKKALRQSSFHQLYLGVEAIDPETFTPMQTKNLKDSLRSCVIAPPEGWEFPAEFEQIADAHNFIAVVHIDGNAMGKRVDGIYQEAGMDWAECCEKLRVFSTSIQTDFEQAYQETVQQVIAHTQDRNNGILPMRPIILAGDDVCFVTEGALGLECARIFLERLSEKTNAVDGQPYAACAGVAMIPHKFPFHAAYMLSEQLCSNAKKFGAQLDEQGRISAMDWHIEFGQLKNDLAQLRQDYQTEDHAHLELRPVCVVVPETCEDAQSLPDMRRTYAFFRYMCQAMQGEYGNIARGKIKELRNALKQGALESKFFMQDKQIENLLYHGFDAVYQDREARWNKYRSAIYQGEALEKDVFYEIDGEKYCLFFDAVELIDRCAFFKEVEA